MKEENSERNIVDVDAVKIFPAFIIYFYTEEKFFASMDKLFAEYDVFKLPNGDMVTATGPDTAYMYIGNENGKKNNSWIG